MPDAWQSQRESFQWGIAASGPRTKPHQPEIEFRRYTGSAWESCPEAMDACYSGHALGPYEILSAIAEEWARSIEPRDTRLGRVVAIKVLPEATVPAVLQVRERFEREARAISSLSHPNICALYDIGNQDGVDYLVMEYLEGQTLADRLKKGPLTLDQVLQDRRPDDGRAGHRAPAWRDSPGSEARQRHAYEIRNAKLLDFGLAKVRDAEAAAGVTAPSLPQTFHSSHGAREQFWVRCNTWRRSSWRARKPTHERTSLRWAR